MSVKNIIKLRVVKNALLDMFAKYTTKWKETFLKKLIIKLLDDEKNGK